MAKGQKRQKQDTIDKDKFEQLCKIQCTKSEISSVFAVDHRTLDSWCKNTYEQDFCIIYKRYTENGRSSLRRAQWKAALNGNVTMQIWLGKNMLSQTDKHDIELHKQLKPSVITRLDGATEELRMDKVDEDGVIEIQAKEID